MLGETRHLELSLPWECREPTMGRMLAAYEWGLLNSTEEEQFEQHLFQCAACAAELASSWPVGESVRVRRRHSRRFAWLSVGLAAAAAAVFVILELGGVMNSPDIPVSLSETDEAVSATAPASWTFELDIPNSNSFSYNLDVPGSS